MCSGMEALHTPLVAGLSKFYQLMKQENTRRITNLSKGTDQIYYLCLYIEYYQCDNSKVVTRTHNSKKKRQYKEKEQTGKK